MNETVPHSAGAGQGWMGGVDVGNAEHGIGAWLWYAVYRFPVPVMVNAGSNPSSQGGTKLIRNRK